MKQIIEIGRRKRSVARAMASEGKGKIRVNGRPLDSIEPEMARLMIMEAVTLGGDTVDKLDINVTVNGGGVISQAEAVRQAIALTLANKSKKLEKIFNDYDRNLLVSDSRRTEPHKPGRSSAGPRRHKQRSKR